MSLCVHHHQSSKQQKYNELHVQHSAESSSMTRLYVTQRTNTESAPPANDNVTLSQNESLST